MYLCSGCKNVVSEKMYGFYWATLYMYVTDTSEQTLVYRGCQLRSVPDGCHAADVNKLPPDLYGVGIILGGSICTCNSAFCNIARSTVDDIGPLIVPLTAVTVLALRHISA